MSRRRCRREMRPRHGVVATKCPAQVIPRAPGASSEGGASWPDERADRSSSNSQLIDHPSTRTPFGSRIGRSSAATGPSVAPSGRPSDSAARRGVLRRDTGCGTRPEVDTLPGRAGSDVATSQTSGTSGFQSFPLVTPGSATGGEANEFAGDTTGASRPLRSLLDRGTICPPSARRPAGLRQSERVEDRRGVHRRGRVRSQSPQGRTRSPSSGRPSATIRCGSRVEARPSGALVESLDSRGGPAGLARRGSHLPERSWARHDGPDRPSDLPRDGSGRRVRAGSDSGKNEGRDGGGPTAGEEDRTTKGARPGGSGRGTAGLRRERIRGRSVSRRFQDDVAAPTKHPAAGIVRVG